MITKTLKHTLLAALTALSLAVAAPVATAHDHDYAGTSVQLWSVKDQVSEDVKGTLKQLADWGFDAVELAGNLGEFGDDAEAFKAYLDSVGLELSGAHVGFDQLSEENFDKTVAFYKTLEVEWLIVPADGRAWSDDGIEAIVADLNAMAEKLAPHGMKIGYHNHQDEFNRYKDTTYWEYMADNTRKDVVLQLDISWAEFAGVDVVALLEKYDDRIRTTHIKSQMARYADVMPLIEEKNPAGWGEKMGLVFGYLNEVTNKDNGISSIVGQDLVDWDAILHQLAHAPEPVWLVIEQEVYPEGMTPMQSVKASKDGVEALIE